MMSKEEKEIRIQLRANRLKRKELNSVLADAREKKKTLLEENDALKVKALALGIQFGKKETA